MTDKQPDTTWNLLRSGQFTSAAERLREVVDAGSAPLDVLHNYAVCFYKTGRFSETLETCMHVLKDFPQSGRTRYLLGVVLKEVGEIDSAIEAFTELIDVSPELARAWYHRGTCHFAGRRLQEAAADLSRAVVLDPLNLPARYNLGVVHVAARRWDDAREDFAACLRLDPTGADEYAELLVEIGRSEVRERVYSQGHRLKNMLGIVGDQLNALLRDVRSRLSGGDHSRSDDISAQQDLIYSDMAAFLNALQPKPLELDLADMAVLFRAHAHSLELQVELTRRQIPFIVRAGLRFFELAHIKDALAHLRWLVNPADELAGFDAIADLEPRSKGALLAAATVVGARRVVVEV